ncbi:MAG: pyridoxamine 5'-phosphate oxidase family protein [Bacteroidales bacterium]|nr:pyridoxamine 5'-phosphate oxidase family protein [Bacteroidales bacterium]
MCRNERKIYSQEEIDEILKNAEICRVALYDGNVPYLVPFNFGIDLNNSNIIYFHCANEGKKLDIINKNPNACFQVETEVLLKPSEKPCGWALNYKSVMALGQIKIVRDLDEKIHRLNCIMSHYYNQNEFRYNENSLFDTTILKFKVAVYTGKKLISKNS